MPSVRIEVALSAVFADRIGVSIGILRIELTMCPKKGDNLTLAPVLNMVRVQRRHVDRRRRLARHFEFMHFVGQNAADADHRIALYHDEPLDQAQVEVVATLLTWVRCGEGSGWDLRGWRWRLEIWECKQIKNVCVFV